MDAYCHMTNEMVVSFLIKDEMPLEFKYSEGASEISIHRHGRQYPYSTIEVMDSVKLDFDDIMRIAEDWIKLYIDSLPMEV